MSKTVPDQSPEAPPYMNLYNGAMGTSMDYYAKRRKEEKDHNNQFHVLMVLSMITAPIIVGFFLLMFTMVWDSWWQENRR